MVWTVAQIALAWYYGHFAEYMIHKYLLHKYGIKKKSIWSFHFKEHHAISRRSGNNIDPVYKNCKNTVKWNRMGKESIALIGLALLHIPLFPIAPWFTLTIWASIAQYYYLHRKSHLDPEWAKKKLPWHYEHHMGKNQHLNWGVRSDMFDRLFGTRKEYLKEENL